MAEHYSIFGRDLRQTYLLHLLQEDGLDALQTEDPALLSGTVILPLPSLAAGGLLRGTERSFSDFLAALPAGTKLWGSGLAPYRETARSITLYDFGDYEAFALDNAIPTAEGALQLAMEELPITIHDGKFLVIGYGRIGTKLAAMLDALGGAVTVARRNPLRLPYRVDRTGEYHTPLFAYDAVFNTAPYPVLSAQQCAALREDCLLIDLASAPGGIAKNCGRRLIHALGLPAKVAPKTAAAILKNIILSETEESSCNT